MSRDAEILAELRLIRGHAAAQTRMLKAMMQEATQGSDSKFVRTLAEEGMTAANDAIMGDRIVDRVRGAQVK